MTSIVLIRTICNTVGGLRVLIGLERKAIFAVYFRRIRDMREDADLTQTQVATHLGIQQTVYSRYERGFQTIPLEHLIKLADLYGVTLDYLTGRTSSKQ